MQPGVAPCPQDAEYGGIAQLVEATDLSPVQYGFESHYPYHKGANSKTI